MSFYLTQCLKFILFIKSTDKVIFDQSINLCETIKIKKNKQKNKLNLNKMQKNKTNQLI